MIGEIRITEGEDEISNLYWLIPVVSAVPLFLCLYIGYKIWQRRKYKKDLAKQKEEKEEKVTAAPKSRIVSKKKTSKSIDMAALSTRRAERELEISLKSQNTNPQAGSARNLLTSADSRKAKTHRRKKSKISQAAEQESAVKQRLQTSQREAANDFDNVIAIPELLEPQITNEQDLPQISEQNLITDISDVTTHNVQGFLRQQNAITASRMSPYMLTEASMRSQLGAQQISGNSPDLTVNTKQQVIQEQIEEENMTSPYKPRKSLPEANNEHVITSERRRQEEHNDRVAQIVEEGPSDDRSYIL